MKVVEAEVFVDEEGVVRIRKTCDAHGYFDDTYTFSDYELYKWAEAYANDGDGLKNPRTEGRNGCPFDCGICPNHKSHTVLAIIDVTNRCNLRCPICFANAAAAGYVYEPTKEEIVEILKNFRRNLPVAPPALQFSGGEPTVREDLPELIRAAREVGFTHVEVNTNGIRIARDVEYFRELMEAGMSTVYLQFDGLSDDIYEKVRGLPLLETKLRVLENARKIGFGSIVLVVTLVRGINDHQMGDIIRFALENSDVVRCVNVQPVSITGRIDRESREKMRINTTDFMKLVEEQTNGMISVKDFRPVPSVVPISRAVGALLNKRFVEFTTSPFCGVATFMVKKSDGSWVPITRLSNVDGFFESMKRVCEDVERGRRLRAKLRALLAPRHVQSLTLAKAILSVVRRGSYGALADFMYRVVMIGCMHFMDPYNFDLDRLQRCVIHYGLPDGTIRPFCSYNSIHREPFEKAHSIPYEEWLELRGEGTSS